MQGRLRRLFRAPPRRAPLSRALSSSPPAKGGGDGGSGVAVKQVTRGNLAEALEELRGRVRDATFVGIDLEMSGVTSAPWRDTFELDRDDVRYLKLRDSAERFAALQLGVCPFRWDPAKSAFVAHPHNFFIFPRKELLSDYSSHEFLCQTTSIDFLAKYQFDFNTCFREGISYLSRAQEEEAIQKLNLLHQDRTSASSTTSEEDGDMPLKSVADILFTERMKNNFKKWRDLLVSKSDGHFSEYTKCATGQFQTVFFKMRPAIMLNGFSSHQLKLIQQVLRKNFRDLVYVCTFGEDDTSEKRVVYSDTEDDKIMLMKDVQEGLLKNREARVKSAIGIRHVIDLLSSERKLIVGHSCFLGAKHEAGYDAYMTGCVFAQLCSYLDIKFEQLSPQDNLAKNNKLQKHVNLLSPCWNSGTVIDLSSGTERPDPGYMRRYPAAVYDNIVLIWGFMSKVRPKEIKDCICKVFGSGSITSVFSIDSTAVLVQFKKQESVNDFLDLKAVLERTDSAISMVHPLSTILEGGQTRAVKYDTYRDICSSSESKYLFADQAEAVCATSKNQLQDNVDDNFTSGVHQSILHDTVLTSVNKGDGTKSGSKNEDDADITCQNILDALHDGRTFLGRRMRS
nr:unnamed protein product [Digitaria exilis]